MKAGFFITYQYFTKVKKYINNMKRTVFIICFIALGLSAGNLFSQPQKKSTTRISYGLKLGMGISTIMNNGEAMDWQFAYAGGAFMQFKLSSTVSLYAELNYSAKGEDTEHSVQLDDKLQIHKVHTNTNLSYLEIPILANFHTNSFSVLVGPYFAFKLSDSFKYNGAETSPKPKFNAMDIGISAGLLVPMQENIYFDIRLNYGFRGIIDKEKIPSAISGFYSDKTTNFNLTGGISLTL